MIVSALGTDYQALNQRVRECSLGENITINDCYGERFIGCGLDGKDITINGTPGNALGAYLDGSKITVNGNVQDAVGDTMNEGEIIVHGNAGDALGYGMRGGKIYIRGNSGYRTGIHMKQYKEKRPVIIVGGSAGSFLGEYLAGGLIVVLGMDTDKLPIGNFTGTGMHGGKIIIRSNIEPKGLPPQVSIKKAVEAELEEIKSEISQYIDIFNLEIRDIMKKDFYILTPNAKNPYKRLYTPN